MTICWDDMDFRSRLIFWRKQQQRRCKTVCGFSSQTGRCSQHYLTMSSFDFNHLCLKVGQFRDKLKSRNPSVMAKSFLMVLVSGVFLNLCIFVEIFLAQKIVPKKLVMKFWPQHFGPENCPPKLCPEKSTPTLWFWKFVQEIDKCISGPPNILASQNLPICWVFVWQQRHILGFVPSHIFPSPRLHSFSLFQDILTDREPILPFLRCFHVLGNIFNN